MKEVKGTKKAAATEKVEALLSKAKEEIVNDNTKDAVKKLKIKLIERQKAAKLVANMDREIEVLKLKIAQELESIDA